ncbi:hypothetical protein [Alcanivorax jadensis]|uniref:hypothetical protein n=1 Tax=Alcanivorax jadensis TaxID=64988 RepID=UPI002409170F|nr:hypothetical protein [Alcanivorax jadensis]MDF1638817.1 hypothetical protein [Alcanivorax jadensis]
MKLSLINIIVKLLVLMPAILFVVMGVRWLVAPAGVAPDFGLTLSDGIGLSSQIGNMAGFFLVLGSCMLIALISGQRSWYYPPMMLLAITALGRIVAWLLHDATLAVSQIMTEVVVAIILLLASRRLPKEG